NRGDIIDEDGIVRRGEKCRGYRLTPDYWKSHVVHCPDLQVNRAIHRLSMRERETWQNVHHWLQSKLLNLSFNLDRALEILPRLRAKKLSPTAHQVLMTEYCKRLAGLPWELTTDEYGRVHTPITSLARELRECVTWDGEPLVWVDLRNSQPLLLGMLAVKFLDSTKQERQKLLRKQFKKGQKPYKISRSAASHTIHQQSHTNHTPTIPTTTTDYQSEPPHDWWTLG